MVDSPRQRLACQQADHAAAITALRAVRERLRGQRISARTDDPEALARAVFMLIDITVAVMLAQRQEAGRTEDEARAEAIEWLDAQTANAEIELLESGAVFNPATSVLGYGVPGDADRPLPPCRRGIFAFRQVAARRQAHTDPSEPSARAGQGCPRSGAGGGAAKVDRPEAPVSHAAVVDDVLLCLAIVLALLLAAFIGAAIRAPAQPAIEPVQAGPAPAMSGPAPAPKLPVRRLAGARPRPAPPRPAPKAAAGIYPSTPFTAARRGDRHRGRPASTGYRDEARGGPRHPGIPRRSAQRSRRRSVTGTGWLALLQKGFVPRSPAWLPPTGRGFPLCEGTESAGVVGGVGGRRRGSLCRLWEWPRWCWRGGTGWRRRLPPVAWVRCGGAGMRCWAGRWRSSCCGPSMPAIPRRWHGSGPRPGTPRPLRILGWRRCMTMARMAARIW